MKELDFYDDIVAFSFILDSTGAFDNVSQVLAYFEKPYKYNPEYKVWQELNCPGQDSPNWEKFLDKLMELD